MWRICPQLGVKFLADSNRWNVNGMLNLRTVKQMLSVLSQLASENVLAQPSKLFCSWVIKNQTSSTNFLFSSLLQDVGRAKYNVPLATENLYQ